jgi:subtilisin family serine protease
MSFDASASSPELAKAVRYANSKGIVLVASAGNDGQNVMVYPAGYDSVIGVASTSDQDVRSNFSNYGQVVTLAAPGEAIVTTYPRNRYALGWGTSFSAPMVSGAAALLLQIDRSISPREALDALSEAVDINSKGMGEGRLDLVKACIAASRQKWY